MSSHDRAWSTRPAEWGYAALLVDSFRPRGYPDGVCNHGRDVSAEARTGDAFAAGAYLRSRPELRDARIGLIGFSHGAWAVLKAVFASGRLGSGKPFDAAVAFYPSCVPSDSPLETDTLILIGDNDDWTPPARCERWRQSVQTNGHLVEMKSYLGALHAFDMAAPP